MPEQLIFLGSGGSRVVLASQIVGTGGFVLQIAGYQVWIDPGPGALVRAKNYIRSRQTDIIFVSHHHLDHSNDVNAVIDAMTLGGEKKRGILISTNTTINGTEKDSPVLLKAYREALKDAYALNPGDKVTVGPLVFIATPTQHDCDAIGLRLETPLGAIGYTSNTKYFPELVEAFKGCKIIIADVLRPGAEKWPTHFCSEDAATLFKETKPQIGIIAGFGLKMLKANPVWEARDISKKAGITVYAAREGMKIDLNTLFVS